MTQINKTADGVQCECGRITGERCAWSGPSDETVVIEWMPPYLRASHQAAGNRGDYPANGAERLRVHAACADLIMGDDGDWTSVVGNGNDTDSNPA
jgi:hypothetical protein